MKAVRSLLLPFTSGVLTALLAAWLYAPLPVRCVAAGDDGGPAPHRAELPEPGEVSPRGVH